MADYIEGALGKTTLYCSSAVDQYLPENGWTDANNFTKSLKILLPDRKPDVGIVSGEIRSEEGLRAVLQAAIDGHLVIATTECAYVTSAIKRVLDHFPPSDYDEISSMLSKALVGVVAQRFVKKISNGRRTPAFEVMINSPNIADLIQVRDYDQLNKLMSQDQEGMTSMNSALDLLTREH